MKTIRTLVFSIAAALLVVAAGVPTFAQFNTTPGSNLSYVGGIFYAPLYAQRWNVFIQSPTTINAGTVTVTLSAGSVILADGRETTAPFNCTPACAPLAINDANYEVVTPSASSGCNMKSTQVGGQQTCQLTMTFSNSHGAGTQIGSADNGYQEAVNDAAANGGGAVYWVSDTGSLTLSTGGATTTSSQSNFFPINSIVLGVMGRVTTTITGCSSGWEIGDGTTAARFTVANATLTAGTTSVNTGAAWNTAIASTTTGVQLAANKAAVITCTGSNASAGAIHVKAFGWTPVAGAF